MKRRGKRVMAVLAAVLVLAAAAAAAWFLWLRPVSQNKLETILYEEDGALYCLLVSSGDSVRLADRAEGTLTAFGGEGALAYTVQDGVLSVTDLRDADGGYPAVKLDTGVEELHSVCGGALLLYRTGTGELYLHDRNEKALLGRDVSSLLLAPKGDAVLYQDGTDLVWYAPLSMGAQAQPLSEADNFSASITSAARFGTIWFMRDGQAYTQKPGEEKQPLAVPAGEPADVFVAADTVYLVGRETTSVSADQLVTDDMAEADAALEEPVYPQEREEDKPKYPSIRDYWDSELNLDIDRYYADVEAYEQKLAEYEAQRKQLLEQYQKDLTAWNEKVARDRLRAALEQTQIPWTVDSLYCLEGDSAELVSKNYLACCNFSQKRNGTQQLSATSPAVLYTVFLDEQTQKLQLSEVVSAASVQNQIMSKLTAGAYRIAVGKDSFEVCRTPDSAGFENFFLSPAGNLLYYQLDGALYRLDFTSSGGTPVKVADSAADYFVGTEETACYYTVEEETGYALYRGGERLLGNVQPDSIRFTADGTTLLCLTDENEASGLGSLAAVPPQGAPVSISTQTASAGGLSGACIAYLYDYSAVAGYGELRLYTGAESAPLTVSRRVSKILI